jgi:UDP-N-acetyl-2-amino-2-deoxyglucuronate dehydrogenase
MPASPVRVAFVGAGNISHTHVRAAREIPGVEVAGFWARDEEKTARMAQEYGGTAHRELDALLDAAPDVVIVGTPSGLHADHARAVARRGVHVLVEKPLDVTTARVDQLLEAADRSGAKVGVIFQDRTAPALAWLKRVIDAGALGRVFLTSARVRWYRPPEYYGGSRWRGTWALDGGGALMNQGVHTVDLLLWLLGDVARVSAAARTAMHQIQVEDTAVACLEFTSGGVATLEATTAAYPGFPRRLEISGTDGTVVVESDRIVSVDLRNPPPEPPPQDAGNTNAASSSPVVSDVRGHRRVIEDFLGALRDGGAPLCDGRDGRRSVELVEAIYASARTGGPVTLRAAAAGAPDWPGAV